MNGGFDYLPPCVMMKVYERQTTLGDSYDGRLAAVA